MGHEDLYRLVGEIHGMVRDMREEAKEQDRRLRDVEAWKAKLVGGTIVISVICTSLVQIAVKVFF